LGNLCENQGKRILKILYKNKEKKKKKKDQFANIEKYDVQNAIFKKIQGLGCKIKKKC